MCYLNIRIYFQYREPLWPVTRMRWNTTSIRATGHPSVVHHDACHPRRSKKKRNALLRCWPAAKLKLVIARGRHRWSWWWRKMAVPGSALTTASWMMRPRKMPTHFPGLTTPWIFWPGSNGFLPLTWLAGTGRSRFLGKQESRRRLRHIPGCFSFELCRLVFVMHLRHSNV